MKKSILQCDRVVWNYLTFRTAEEVEEAEAPLSKQYAAVIRRRSVASLHVFCRVILNSQAAAQGLRWELKNDSF